MGREILRIEHLHKEFEGKTVLDDLSLTLTEGEVAVIVGPSGCGKSTLLRCVNALEPIQGGSIFLDGEEIHADPRKLPQLRQKVGMVFQSYELFPHKSILDNITLAPRKVQKRGREDAEAEALALLERVGLADRAKDYPRQLSGGQKHPRQLSGGQKQRVAIVRSLIMHPALMLFDEVTAALDPEMVREVLDVLLDLAKQGRTMLIVTHEMQFARAVADRILFLDDGGIVEEGRPADFFDHPKTERAQRFLNTFTFETVKE